MVSLLRWCTGPRTAIMLELYFDESGTHDDKMLTLAGFVADAGQWVRFSWEWCDWLSKTPFDHFHAKDFFTWAKARKNRALAHEVLRGLLGVATRRLIRGFCYSLPPSVYKATASNEFRSELGAPYTMCIQECIVAISRWADTGGHDEPFAYFFESGHKNAGQLLDHMRTLKECPATERSFRIGSVTMASKKDFVPLQAADLLAYRMNRLIRTGRHGFLTDVDWERKFSELVGPSIVADRERVNWMIACAATEGSIPVGSIGE